MQPILPNQLNGAVENEETQLKKSDKNAVHEELWQSIAQNLGLNDCSPAAPAAPRPKSEEFSNGVIDPTQYAFTLGEF